MILTTQHAHVPHPRTESLGLGRAELSADARSLFDELKARDNDPAYADALIIDAYARISINRSTGEHEKTDRQIGDILAAIHARKARLGIIHRDDNFSAWRLSGSRPGWLQLLERIKSGEAQGVGVWRVDRLLRQPRDLERLLDLAQTGTMVYATDGEHDLSADKSQIVLRVKVAVACEESLNNSLRQKRKQEAMRAQGKRHGGSRPFGEAGEGVSAEDVQAERDAIRKAVADYLADRKTFTEVAREWNALGFRTRTGLEHSNSRVRQIMEQPRIAGYVIHDREIVGTRSDFEPIISREDFDLLQARLKSQKRGRPIGLGSTMLSGVLTCGACGKRLNGKIQKRPTGTELQYRCSPGSGCGSVTVKASAIEPLIRERVIEELAAPEYAEGVQRRKAELAELQEKVRDAESRIAMMAGKFARREMKLAAWEAMSPILDADLDAAEGAVANFALMSSPLEYEDDGTLNKDAADSEALERVSAQWDEGSSHAQALARRAFKSIVVSRATSTRQPAKDRVEFIPWD